MPSPPLGPSAEAAIFTRDSTELTDPKVVPSLADRWSHHTGGTHFKVVPCHWRATVLVRAYSVVGQLGRDGAVELVSLEIDVGHDWR